MFCILLVLLHETVVKGRDPFDDFVDFILCGKDRCAEVERPVHLSKTRPRHYNDSSSIEKLRSSARAGCAEASVNNTHEPTCDKEKGGRGNGMSG